MSLSSLSVAPSSVPTLYCLTRSHDRLDSPPYHPRPRMQTHRRRVGRLAHAALALDPRVPVLYVWSVQTSQRRAACRFCNFRLLNTALLVTVRRAETHRDHQILCSAGQKLQNRQAARAQTYGISESPWHCHRQCRFVVHPYNQLALTYIQISCNLYKLNMSRTTWNYLLLQRAACDRRHRVMSRTWLNELCGRQMMARWDPRRVSFPTRGGSIFSDENCSRRSLRTPKVQYM